MQLYPIKFDPIYKEKIWGGRNLERLFARHLPGNAPIGESWELADLVEGVSVVANGPFAGRTLTYLTEHLGEKLLGKTKPTEDGRFPLLLKLLDANDILSLQVHPDAKAVAEIGEDAALKTECWYVLESRDGSIFKGVKPGTTPEQFRDAIEHHKAEEFTRKIECKTHDFHYLPAGTVHALGAGLVVAEVQTPSDTTYRVTDWGRGREIHVERSMQCIHFEPADDAAPGAGGDVLLATEYFVVARKELAAGENVAVAPGKCVALMIVEGAGSVSHSGEAETQVEFSAGDTILLPAELKDAKICADGQLSWLHVTLPETQDQKA